MKVQEMKDVFIIIKANISLFKRDPDTYVPYGIDMLSESQLDIFDAEMERVFQSFNK